MKPLVFNKDINNSIFGRGDADFGQANATRKPEGRRRVLSTIIRQTLALPAFHNPAMP